jgi:hypothetical protein
LALIDSLQNTIFIIFSTEYAITLRLVDASFGPEGSGLRGRRILRCDSRVMSVQTIHRSRWTSGSLFFIGQTMKLHEICEQGIGPGRRCPEYRATTVVEYGFWLATDFEFNPYFRIIEDC